MLRLSAIKPGNEANAVFLLGRKFLSCLCTVLPVLVLVISSFVYIAGVVETGLFVGMAARAYFGQSDASVKVVNRK